MWTPANDQTGRAVCFSPYEQSGEATPANKANTPNFANQSNRFDTVVPLSQQIGVPDSLYEYTKQAINCRKDKSQLRQGEFVPIVAPTPGDFSGAIEFRNADRSAPADEPDKIFSFVRLLNNVPVWCIFNFGPEINVVFIPNNEVPFANSYTQIEVLNSHNPTVGPIINGFVGFDTNMNTNSSLIVSPIIDELNF